MACVHVNFNHIFGFLICQHGTPVLGLEVDIYSKQEHYIIIDYHWLPHWKCTVNLSYQIGICSIIY